ncbi:Protocadherin alpha-2 [Fasciola hepatica]|uniref:Protocadherin alpha-2 n=1 Tax=Fasciola hepatica TaxID=6192 RepID=A0A4E0RFK9_FASHE|nr:Protocadherin alpha-2 [Fasciola hepatica]
MHWGKESQSVFIFLLTAIAATQISCSESIPTVVFNLADETPSDAVVGNIADSLVPGLGNNVTFVLMISRRFPYLSDFFRLTSYGDLTTLRPIDRDNTNEVCGPLTCCKLTVCEINATVYFQEVIDPSGTQLVSIITEDKISGHSATQGTIQLSIRINDANDNAPHFLPSDFQATTGNKDLSGEQPFTVYLLEGEPTTMEQLPVAVDADSQSNGIVEYRLIEFIGAEHSGRKPCLTVVTKGSLNIQPLSNSSGQSGMDMLLPFLKQTRPLDYEDIYDRQISVVLLAIDGGTPPLTGSLSIVIHLLDVNDNSPVFNYTPGEPRIVLPENTTAGSNPIFFAKATDKDSGENGRVTHLLSPLANTEISRKFSVDPVTGAVRILQALDYELYSERSFVLPLVAIDAGSPQRSATMSVHVEVQDINDNMPILVVQENTTVPEGDSVTKPVIKFYVKDEDEISQGHIQCDQQNNSESSNDPEVVAGAQFLRLHKVSATVFFVFAKAVMDFETTPRATLILHCTDQAPLPKFDKRFELPQISMHSLIRVTVAVQDRNDNSPHFIRDSYFARIPEHSPEGTFVVKVAALDGDNGEYGEVTYHLNGVSFTEGTSKLPRSGTIPFTIDRKSGTVSVLQSFMLDRELFSNFSFEVIAKDKGGLTALTVVEVELTDVNDHTPNLLGAKEFSLVENHRPETIIGRIHLIDQDQGVNSRIHIVETSETRPGMTQFIRMVSDPNFRYSPGYAVKNDSSNEKRNVELVGDGEVRALLLSRIPVDRETYPVLFFEVVAFDEGEPAQTVTVTATVSVLDQNDNAPTVVYPLAGSILSPHQKIDINSPARSHVIRLHATDPDEGENGTVFYQIQAGANGSRFFGINSTSGEISTLWPIKNKDHESEVDRMSNAAFLLSDGMYPIPGIYEIIVLVRDSGDPAQTTQHKLYVTISSSNSSLSAAESLAFASDETALQSFIRHATVNKTLLVALAVFTVIILSFIPIYCLWSTILRKQNTSKPTKKLVLGNRDSNLTDNGNVTPYNDPAPNWSVSGNRTASLIYQIPDNNNSMVIKKYDSPKCGNIYYANQPDFRGFEDSSAGTISGIGCELSLSSKPNYATGNRKDYFGVNFCPGPIVPPDSCCADQEIMYYFN